MKNKDSIKNIYYNYQTEKSKRTLETKTFNQSHCFQIKTYTCIRMKQQKMNNKIQCMMNILKHAIDKEQKTTKISIRHKDY